MGHWDLIDEIAAASGVSSNTRRMWRERGVPYRHHLLVIAEAAKRGVTLTGDELRTPAPKTAEDPFGVERAPSRESAA